MGYKLAGFRVVGNVEIDPRIAEVYERNLRPERSWVMDIRDFNRLEDLPDELCHLDVLDGSPPCSTFSMAGSRERAWGVEKRFAEGQKVQRLDDLFFAYLETVGRLRPKCFIAENVTGIIAGNARGYVHEIVERSKELGYSVQIFRLNAAFMGVPQRRERVFFVGNRMGWPGLRLEFRGEPIPFGDARGDAPGAEIVPSVAEQLPMVRHHEASISKARSRNGLKNSFYNWTMCWDDRPAPTLTAECRLIRMCDRTMLGAEDARNISTFPQDYDFSGADPFFICGMSVPPVMMAHVASEVRRQWLER